MVQAHIMAQVHIFLHQRIVAQAHIQTSFQIIIEPVFQGIYFVQIGKVVNFSFKWHQWLVDKILTLQEIEQNFHIFMFSHSDDFMEQ
jgi:hypothetical protein